MSSLRSRQLILVLGAVAVAAGSLLVAGSALAEPAMFRIEQSFWNFPNPAQTPGGMGHNTSSIIPYVDPYVTIPYEALVGNVQAGNPIGGAFTLPSRIFAFSGTGSITPATGWYGYTTITYYDYYNGPVKMRPSNGPSSALRMVFPTTGGNPSPVWDPEAKMPDGVNPTRYGAWFSGNLGTGNPTPSAVTTTFDGRYDKTRAGSINITPGTNRFGGTMRLFYGPNARMYQYIDYFTPKIFTVEGVYLCRDHGNVTCTKDTFETNAGDVTQMYAFYRYLLKQTTAQYRATTPPTGSGKYPTPNSNASYVVGINRYLNTLHPWTTGYVKVHNSAELQTRHMTGMGTGYDYNAGYVPFHVTFSNKYQNMNETLQTLTTTTNTLQQYMSNVGRIVSMVRPRMTQTYTVPLPGSGDSIENTWSVQRVWGLKVFFLPEPAGMLLLGGGIATLLGLSRMRRR